MYFSLAPFVILTGIHIIAYKGQSTYLLEAPHNCFTACLEGFGCLFRKGKSAFDFGNLFVRFVDEFVNLCLITASVMKLCNANLTAVSNKGIVAG